MCKALTCKHDTLGKAASLGEVLWQNRPEDVNNDAPSKTDQYSLAANDCCQL